MAKMVTFFLIEFQDGRKSIQNVSYCSQKEAKLFVENTNSSIEEFPYEIAMSMTEDEFEIFKQKITN
jgi:hypothetical protein